MTKNIALDGSKGVRVAVLSNYISMAVSTLVPIVAIPFYMRYVGVVGWGWISVPLFYQSLIAMLEAGWGQALTRELSQRSLDVLEVGEYISRMERLYKISALSVLFVFCGFAIFGGTFVEGVDRWRVISAGVLAATTLAGLLYKSVLLAYQRHMRLAGLNIGSIILKTMAALWVAKATGNVLYIICVIAIGNVTEYFVRRAMCGLKVSETVIGGIRCLEICDLSRLAVPISIGVLASQSDRLVLSGVLTASEFGVFATASTLAIGLTQITSPLVQVYFPKINRAANVDELRLKKINVQLFIIISGLAVFLTIACAVMGKNLVGLWIPNERAKEEIWSIFSVMFIGTIINMFYNILYMNIVARGLGGTIMLINIFCLAVVLVLAPAVVRVYGVEFSGFGWILVNAVGLIVFSIRLAVMAAKGGA